MSGFSRARPRPNRLPLCFALLAAVWTTQAAAQTEPAQRAAPMPLLPQSSSPPPQATSPLSPVIAVDTLDRLSVDRVGLIDASSGGMPDAMWSGSDPALVRALLAQLPHAMPSPAMRKLAQHLLLPQARKPRLAAPKPLYDAGAPIEPTALPETADDGPWLLEARIGALAAMGDWPDALALIELVPSGNQTSILRRLHIDGLLITSQNDAACGETQTALAREPDTRWQKIQVYCQFLTKQASAAQLGLSLLREQGLDDPAFFWAADTMQGVRAEPPAGETHLPALELAMLRTAGQPFPEAILHDADPTTLRVATTMSLAASAPTPEDKKLSADEKKKRLRAQQDGRVLAAERAMALGVLGPETVRDLYLKLDLSQEPPAVPLAEATAENVRTRAYMYRLAKTQDVPTARAEVIARVIDLARADKGEKGLDLVSVGRIYAPLLTDFTPSPDLIWFAGYAARGLLAAGMPDKALAWIDLTQQMARGSIEAAGIADALWPITYLGAMGAQERATGEALRAWQSAVPAGSSAVLRAPLLNLLMAVGDQISSSDWAPVLGAPSGGTNGLSAHVWHGLSLAARDNRIGEAAALSLIALGEDGPSRAAPLTVYKVIESLRAVGREADARLLAVEAALVQGL